MNVIIQNNSNYISIMEAKVGKVYIIINTSTDKLEHYKNNVIIRIDNFESSFITLLIIGSSITQLTLDKRECDKSEYKLFKLTEVTIEKIEVKLLHD